MGLFLAPRAHTRSCIPKGGYMVMAGASKMTAVGGIALQLLHAVPFQDFCHKPLSGPSTTRSIKFAALENAPGAEARAPPSDSKPLHLIPSYHLCHKPLSVPPTKTSSR